MNKIIPKIKLRTPYRNPLLYAALIGLTTFSCQEKKPEDLRIKNMTKEAVAQQAQTIENVVTPELAQGLSLKIWGVDSLVADPIGIDIDNQGKLYYTRTNRQKNSEFDIRGHQDWEIGSIQLKTVEEKREFLHKTLSPENSKKNEWLADLNNDGSHDWKDMTVEKENVYRLEDTDGDGLADKSQLVVDDFHDEVTDVAGAVLIEGEDLFVGVGPDLWRLKDKNADGIADDKTSISHGYGIHIGFGGHGMSGLEMGPDGKIYWGIGDIGFNGEGPDGTKWEYPNRGVIVRSNPDGSDFEVFAMGLRNTHEFVFDEYGNLISQDNDGDHPGEKERLVYVVNGSDTGWRTNWQFGKYRDPKNNTYKVWMDEEMFKPRWEGQAAYITPCIQNFVSGPTGMLYNPGTALSPAWKNTFFIVEFVGNPARSGIHSFKLKPKGATFELGDHDMIAKGVLATGIDFGPDGAMYVADWIDGWNTKDYGRIWKLDADGGSDWDERKQTQTLLEADFTEYESAQLGDLLKNPDMRVRLKAQFELAKKGEEGATEFQKNIDQKANQLARVNGIWGMAQLARQDSQYAKALLPLLQDEDEEIRAQAAKWLGDIRYKEAGDALMPLLKDDYSRARFFAAEALGRISYQPAVQPIIDMLEANNDKDAYLRHAGSLALARIGNADPILALADSPSRALRIAAVVALRRLGNPGISKFLNDQDEFVVTETARAINDDLNIQDALPALGNVLKNTKFTNEPLIRRAINANLEVGTEEALQNLLGYAANSKAPSAMRAEALDALSTWTSPSVLDRVDGRFRGEMNRDAAQVQMLAATPLINLLKASAPEVRLSAAHALGSLKIEKGAAPLLAQLKSDSKPEVRIASLEALAAMNAGQMEQAIEQAMADREKSVRVAGLDLMADLDMSKDLMVSLLSDVVKNRTTEEKQAALVTLGTLPAENTKPIFETLLTQLKSGKFPAEIQLELEEAIDSTKSDQLIAQLDEIQKNKETGDVLVAYQDCMFGGDADRGARILYSHQTAQCLRCHSYDDQGGNAGPRLNGIAGKLSRQQILQALVDPSARLSPGYGVVTLEMEGGKTMGGILQGETDTELILKMGDKPDTTIMKEQIVKRTNAASSMPDMKNLLTKKEIRDVVSFLSTLKEDDI